MSILNNRKKGNKQKPQLGFRTPYSFPSSSTDKEQKEEKKEEKTQIFRTPRQYKNEARSQNINVAVSRTEKANWKREAKKRRLTLSAYIRWKMNS